MTTLTPTEMLTLALLLPEGVRTVQHMLTDLDARVATALEPLRAETYGVMSDAFRRDAVAHHLTHVYGHATDHWISLLDDREVIASASARGEPWVDAVLAGHGGPVADALRQLDRALRGVPDAPSGPKATPAAVPGSAPTTPPRAVTTRGGERDERAERVIRLQRRFAGITPAELQRAFAQAGLDRAAANFSRIVKVEPHELEDFRAGGAVSLPGTELLREIETLLDRGAVSLPVNASAAAHPARPPETRDARAAHMETVMRLIRDVAGDEPGLNVDTLHGRLQQRGVDISASMVNTLRIFTPERRAAYVAGQQLVVVGAERLAELELQLRRVRSDMLRDAQQRIRGQLRSNDHPDALRARLAERGIEMTRAALEQLAGAADPAATPGVNPHALLAATETLEDHGTAQGDELRRDYIRSRVTQLPHTVDALASELSTTAEVVRRIITQIPELTLRGDTVDHVDRAGE